MDDITRGGWQPTKGAKRNRKQRDKFRDIQQRRYLKSLTKKQLTSLRKALTQFDEGLDMPTDIGATLGLWEGIARRGKKFVDKARGR